MSQRLSLVTLLVRDYDEALTWFRDRAGFELVEDTDRGDGTRWVVVRPAGSAGTQVLLARASTPEQEARVGDPGGGRVMHFLATDDFAADHERMVAAGVGSARSRGTRSTATSRSSRTSTATPGT